MFEYSPSQRHYGPDKSRVSSVLVNTWVGALSDESETEPAQQPDAELIDRIRALEELKAAASAAQARAAAAFDASQRRKQALAEVPKDKQGCGVASQIALARRESANRGGRLLGFAKALTQEMPCTLQALSQGKISEWRATLLVRETACLSVEDRQRVDREIAGNPELLETLGDRQIISRARTAAYRLDPRAAVNRAAKAASERFVSCRPAPDTMTYLTGLLPVAQGVGVYAALSQEADRLTAAGDGRTRGQIMADTLVGRITGQAHPDSMKVEVQLVMTDRTLLAGESEPAFVPGYGPVPAQWARDLVRSRSRGKGKGKSWGQDKGQGRGQDKGQQESQTKRKQEGRGQDRNVQTFIRRLYAAPGTGELVAMDARARLFPTSLARFIAARDQTCRMPWCGAPIRHFDHIRPHSRGGPTKAENGQGLCEACNHAKEAPGWSAEVVKPPGTGGIAGALGGNGATGAIGAPGAPGAASATGAAGEIGMVGGPGMVGSPGHTVETSTPTGHTYRSTAPPLVGTPEDVSAVVDRVMADLVWAA
ncbi:HNH endonuclease [Arthrobacter zhaoxinii]|uniref:HNH endonuclease n=1 Tax=Arthrobacter zhaoxinii TaxID=2964616 RepID=UPI00272DA845|nr:HNH endonuclease signature motif containing protein [Arthrobacter zhaoxinii]